MDAQPRLLQPTKLLDFAHPAIEALVQERGWWQLPIHERIGAVYDFVRNEIAFGYNEGDELPASEVLADGIGQCNTLPYRWTTDPMNSKLHWPVCRALTRPMD